MQEVESETRKKFSIRKDFSTLATEDMRSFLADCLRDGAICAFEEIRNAIYQMRQISTMGRAPLAGYYFGYLRGYFDKLGMSSDRRELLDSYLRTE